MSCYENLVMKTQMNYSRHYSTYASGGTAVVLSKQKPLPYEEQIQEFVRRVQEAECIIVGGASGLSAAGGGDFYYSDTPSFREHFGKFADKYGFKGAFSGMMHRFSTRNEHWGYVATFLNTTQNAPIREPYLDLDRILQGKEFHILTTNQDTQFVKIYPEEKVSEIQGDHRFFQCSQCCQDETWDAVQPVADMIAAMGEGTIVPDELIGNYEGSTGKAVFTISKNNSASTDPTNPSNPNGDKNVTDKKVSNNTNNVKPVVKNVAAKNNKNVPKTGDNANVLLWIALAVISCGVLAGAGVAVRKRK